MFYSKKLSKFSEINHGFFNKKGGVSKGIYKSLNCGTGSKDKKANIKKNLEIVKKKISEKSKQIFLVKQIHGNKFIFLDKSSIINYELPGDLNSAIELSKKNNPDLIIAKLEYEQSIKDKSIAKSDLAPTAKLSFERSYTEDLNTTYDEREKDTVKATVSWPFFSGGKNIAKYKKNQSLENRKRLILDSAVKQNQTDVASAWSNYQSNRSLLNSVQSQVKAAEIANEGIAAEYNSGAGRTTLEVIQSNSLLLNAQISLADSERNYILSQFNLLKSLGLLNSDYLKIR